MTTYLLAMGLILVVMVGWVAVQQLYRSFAANHPEFGPVERGGCGGGCSCGASRTCSKR